MSLFVKNTFLFTDEKRKTSTIEPIWFGDKELTYILIVFNILLNITMEQHEEDSAVSVVFETKIINQLLTQCSLDTIKSIRRLNRAIQRASRDFVLRHFSFNLRYVKAIFFFGRKNQKDGDRLDGQSLWNREFWEHLSGVKSGSKPWMKRVTEIKYDDSLKDKDVIPGFPESVQTVHLGNYFRSEVTSELGWRITRLSFGKFFNQKVDDLPPTLTHLKFGDKFKQKVDHLPSGLTHLQFGRKFNRKVNRLPNSLLVLRFGAGYNRITDSLPSSLTDLEFGFCFNQCVDNLPQSLINLTLGDWFNQTVDYLPESLETLKFGSEFHRRVDHLPSRLTKLTFGYVFDKTVDHLPESLEFVKFGCFFTRPLLSLPKSVKTLILDDGYDGPINNLSPGCVILYYDDIMCKGIVEKWKFDGIEYKALYQSKERERPNHGACQTMSECT